MSLNRGEEFHAEISSADAHLGISTFTWYNQAGGVITPAPPTSVLITDLNLVAAAGGAVSVKAVNGTNSMSLFAGTVATNAGVSRNWNTPFMIPAGWTLTLTAPAGQVDCQIDGGILYV